MRLNLFHFEESTFKFWVPVNDNFGGKSDGETDFTVELNWHAAYGVVRGFMLPSASLSNCLFLWVKTLAMKFNSKEKEQRRVWSRFRRRITQFLMKIWDSVKRVRFFSGLNKVFLKGCIVRSILMSEAKRIVNILVKSSVKAFQP